MAEISRRKAGSKWGSVLTGARAHVVLENLVTPSGDWPVPYVRALFPLLSFPLVFTAPVVSPTPGWLRLRTFSTPFPSSHKTLMHAHTSRACLDVLVTACHGQQHQPELQPASLLSQSVSLLGHRGLSVSGLPCGVGEAGSGVRHSVQRT